ncbi:MAG: hypothetical protein HY078_11390 [Elusimicrobia bacterium]|nr:hypothetical protein [Elusimicrobiota bacterium]
MIRPSGRLLRYFAACWLLAAPAALAAEPRFRILLAPDVPVDAKAAADLDRVRGILRETYPLLPENLRALAAEITYVIHREHPIYAPAWSAEDDPEYIFPDTNLFPAGTIKVNVSKHFLEWVEGLADARAAGTQPAVAARKIHGTIAHELEHARRYRTDPIPDLRVPDACPEGLCRLDLIEGEELKFRHERETAELEESLFRDGALVDFRRETRNYRAAFEPPKLVWAVKRANDALESGGAQAREGAPVRVKTWRSDWEFYTNVPRVLEAHPYLKQVQARFEAEIARHLRLAAE